ncbi:class I SAM-dependent methyltransferase [Streptomyces collinus]|uniref:Phospholipid N-methyltransferase n=2 Tax=Streptomyces TaxID=1883 RepID=A0AA89THE0_STRCU|nr:MULTISPECIES: SAM-dependent methyltransferase [Streptomyces]MBB5812816.1 phospholipid N-methyltransferase [Streptomyces collinus]MEC7055708.1 SAM-dependent methyltransferase [Streptomyces violaceochromogenes]WMX65949.1 SAM-dependent methyltransferase [Streptomyces collinus]GHC74647.1 methyltransferase [Streptomyces violaceochromogenes]
MAPSSRRLATEVTLPVPESGDPVVVELGPGTGAFTGLIQELLGGRGHHLAVEINPRLASSLAERFPRVQVLNDEAAALPRLLAERGLGVADAVISGLPWASLDLTTQRTTLDSVRRSLAPQGAFTTFGYVHATYLSSARRFRRMLGSSFEEVVPGRTVWGNLPPAFVYHARRPRPRLAPATLDLLVAQVGARAAASTGMRF